MSLRYRIDNMFIIKRYLFFFSFPRDIERKKKWLVALNLQNYCPPKTGAVCSEHFKEQNYDSQHSLRKLKKDALPCVCTIES